MSRLETPLRQHLEDGFDEADVQRNWRGVQRRLARRGRKDHTKERPGWALALGLALAALTFALWLWPGETSSVGPLRLAGEPSPVAQGASFEVKATASELSDGSRVTLAPDAQLEVLENSEHLFLTALRRGASTFDIKPGGPRRWVIECGLATVEVVGTQFSIRRTADTLDVVVDRGVVIVRGGHVRDQVRLVAGERITLHEPADEGWERAADTPPREPASTEDVDAAVASMAVTAPASIRPPASGTATSVSSPVGVPSSVGAPSPAVLPSASPIADRIDIMLRDADQAQRAGDRPRATELLRQVIKEAHGDPRASFAGFTLARWMIDEDPQAAARALATMLDDGVPQGLEEDARARLVEAYARAGNRDRAESAAADYARRFPNGSRLEEVRRWARR